MILQWHEVIKLAVKQIGKRAVYVSNDLSYDSPQDDKIWQFVIDEIKAKFPDNAYNLLSGVTNSGLFFFDTEEEQYKFYDIFEQPLTDSSAIYASTYDADGECETENT